MRGALSGAAGADFVSRASRTSPSPSASVDLAHLRPACGRIGHATRNTSSEPEAEGEFSPSLPAIYEARGSAVSALVFVASRCQISCRWLMEA